MCNIYVVKEFLCKPEVQDMLGEVTCKVHGRNHLSSNYIMLAKTDSALM